ncbi:MAG: biotin/lipoyl-containing protein [Gemmatimonadales bacterium]
MKYFVTMGGEEIEVAVDGDRITVDGREYRAHLSAVPGTPLRYLQLGARSFTLAMVSGGRGLWSLDLQGERREVEVLDERARHIRSLSAGAGMSTGPAVLKAPMPGLVVRVLVSPGQQVGTGSGLLVLEAMKMENELRATAPGVIRAVSVQPGQAVDRGQVLIEFAEG